MHFPRPWYRKAEKAYYVQIGKRQLRLGRTAQEAEEKFKELLLLDLVPGDPLPRVHPMKELCKLFLRWSKRQHEPATTQWYRDFLKSFCRCYGSRSAHQLKPLNVDHWLDQHPGWGESTTRSAVITVQRVLNWAVKKKLIRESPLKDVEKPAMQRRERVLDGNEHERIFAAIPDEPFRDFVLAMRETGCRPGEIMKLTAENVSADGTMWILSKHKTKKRPAASASSISHL